MDQNEHPGFRRHFVITPGSGRVTAALEDDIHCMAVTLHHDGAVITGVEADMVRWPWTTCPGAAAKLEQTFVGLALNDAKQRGGKKSNCTHLYDLAAHAAAHALDGGPIHFVMAVSDPVAGRNTARLWRNGDLVLDWQLENDVVVEPEGPAGQHLMQLRDWIATLEETGREHARLLQWASLVAHGRNMAWSAQDDTSHMPPNCHTFQPENTVNARRIDGRQDFSSGERLPLHNWNGSAFSEG